MEMTFIHSPFFTMSSIFKCPDPKTMAFGGVATGSINAQEAATVAPTNKKNGCTSMAFASDAKTGNIRAVVAIFDVISVMKLTEAIMISSKTINGKVSKDFNCSPVQSANPLD